MSKQKLSDAAKSLMNFEEVDKPITFTETLKKPVDVPKLLEKKRVVSNQAIADIHNAIRFMKEADCKEFDAFLETKSSYTNVTTDNDIFDKHKFDADLKDLERRYTDETLWLKSHQPKNTDEMKAWTQRLQERDALKTLLPRETDARYHSKEIISVTKTGLECKRLLEQFNRDWNDVYTFYHKQQVEEHASLHKITMDEDTFKFCKMLHQLDQLDISKIPTTLIHTGSTMVTTRDDLRQALNFESVVEYNKSLDSLDIPLNDKRKENCETAQTALINNDIIMAALAMMNYTKEFHATVNYNNLRDELLDTPLR